MKKNALIVCTLLAAMFSSCSNEDIQELSATGNQDVVTNRSFTVIDEKEVSEEQFLADAVAGITDKADASQLSELKTTCKQSFAELEDNGEGTRGIVPAIYKSVHVTYETLDEANKPVTASALIVYPLFKKIKNVMLINHGTQIGAMMIPSNYTSVESVMAATGSLCILPDYIGLGATSDHPDLYLNSEVHGRTSVDALLTLLDYAEQKSISLDSNYDTYILGYSQGGAVSLASLRRVQQLDAATQSRLHLKKVYCGDGPYDLRLTFETYLSDLENGKDMALGSVIPTVINSMFNSYPEEMAGINYEDFFTAWALKTGVPQAIRQNKEGILDMIVKWNGASLDQILNFDYLNAHPEHLDRLLQMMDRQNLCKGWMPKYPLKLIHSNPDGVVPFANFEEAYANLKNEYVEEPTIITPTTNNALLQHINGMLVMIAEVFKDI